ncbi:MAG: T9SS type A sorting domain-containing protein [bacterium]|nr:MAG: T9SS type A sorting domain-containing protein [bacterium]
MIKMIIRYLTRYSFILLILTSFTTSGFAQSALPIEAYGVWDRNNGEDFDPNDPNYDYLLGISLSASTWSDIQPDIPGNMDSSNFNWQGLQETIDRATNRNQYMYIGINFGPDAPQWIYENGVPKVYTDDTSHSKWPHYPYYLDADYKRFYYRFIRELGNFLQSQPEHKLNRVAFIQVKTGCTGDEAAYKGTPNDPQYNLPKSGKSWRDFRLATFDSFKVAFNTGKNSIPLLFNDVDPVSFSEEWNWVITNIGEGFGIKEGALVRGHHLTDERNVINQWKPYLVNPQDTALFARSEMDQTWTKPMYQINTELGFYWGAINGLNQGLSVWDISQSALIEAGTNPSIQQTFRFFNKYANQIYPSSSTQAFIVLHEGLNSADTDRFPESIYGNASKSNVARYEGICNDSVYASRGTKMDDLDAVVKGQVYQRSNQIGYNDAGWEIWPTNYSRFITQVDPDNESIGLFRVGGTIDASSPIYSRFARSFEYRTGKNAMYFKLHDDFFSSPADTVTMTVIYYDKNQDSKWELQYDAGEGNFKTAYSVTCTGSKTWKTKTHVVTDAVLLHHGPQDCDFALVNTDTLDDIFHMIEIEKGGKSEPTSVGEANTNKIHTYALNQNYPNPFNPVTQIKYSLSEDAHVQLEVYDVLGRKIRTLVDRKQSRGNSHSVQWSGKNQSGQNSAAGVYLYRLRASSKTRVFTDTKKMLLLK